MWHVNNVTIPTGEKATIWGGLGNDVGPRALGDRLGPEGAQYVLSVPHVGALVLEDAGAHPTEWEIKVNGGQKYVYHGEGQLNVSIDESHIATISGGEGQLQVPLLARMDQTGAITQTVFKLVNGAPSLHGAWNSDPMALLWKAGFPETAMMNLRQTIGTVPDCCQQFETWLQTVKFTETADLDSSWFECTACRMWVAGLTAATLFVVVAACMAASPEIAAAIPVLVEAPSMAALATAINTSVLAVVQMAVRTFAQAGAAVAFAALVDGVCELGGYCGSSDLGLEPAPS